MAKGLRSQRLRKFKEMKRQRYAVKELDRLKKMLGVVDNTVKTDVDMEQFKDVATVVEQKPPVPRHVLEFGYKDYKRKRKLDEKKEKAREVQRLLNEDSDEENEDKKFDMSLMVDGKYPEWLHQRKVKKLKKIKKKIVKKELKRSRQKKKY